MEENSKHDRRAHNILWLFYFNAKKIDHRFQYSGFFNRVVPNLIYPEKWSFTCLMEKLFYKKAWPVLYIIAQQLKWLTMAPNNSK